MFDRILLAVDGSEHALHAARVAADLARAAEATELRIVTAYEPVPAYLGEPNLSSAIHARLTESQDVLHEAEEAIGKIPTEIHEELIEGQVGVVGVDNPVAPHPHLAGRVILVTRRVAKPRQVKPEVGHLLAVAWRCQQALDDLLVSAGRGVGEKSVELRESWRQPGQIERDTAEQRDPVGFWRCFEVRCLAFRVDKPINRISDL